MRILAFIFIFFTHSILASQDFEQLYAHRTLKAEKAIEDLQKEVITSLSAKIDTAREVQKKIHEKLTRLETSPPATSDPFRDEFMPHVALIVPPEQCFTEQQAQALSGSLSLENLRPLSDKIAPLKQCGEKWEAIVAHAETIHTVVNQMIWFQAEWDRFFEKISTQLADFKLTPSDLKEIFDQFLYFHNQLSHFRESQERLNRELATTQASMPETLAYLETTQKELMIIYENRAKLLWEILWESFNKLVPESSIPQNYSDLSNANYKDYFLDNHNPIKTALDKLTKSAPAELPAFSQAISTPRDSNTPIGTPRFSSFTQAFAASPRSSPAPDDTAPLGLVRSSSTSSKAVTASPTSLQYASSEPRLVMSRRHSTAPRTSLSTRQQFDNDDDNGQYDVEKSSSLPASDKIAQKENSPEIRVLRDGSEKNQIFIAKFKAAFEKSETWGEKRRRFKEKFNYLRNIKFILDPLDEYFGHCNSFKESLMTSSDKTRELLLPPAHLLMHSQPLRRIPQTVAYKVCSLKSNGPLCFGVPEKAEQSTVALIHTRDGLQYSVRETYPSQIDQKIALEILEALFGIQSAPSLFLAIENIRTIKPPKSLGNRKQADVCLDYLGHQDEWPVRYSHNFVMAQRTPSSLSLHAWWAQVCNAEKSVNELCPRSYGQATLFSVLTQSKVASIDYVLEPQEGKLALKRVGFTPFQCPAFQNYQDDDQSEVRDSHLFVGHNALYLLPGAYEVIPEEVKRDFTNNNIELICANWLQTLTEYHITLSKLTQDYGLNNIQDELANDIDQDLSVARALGLSMLFPPHSIDRLISRFHRMVDLLKNPTITYAQLHKVLEPQEAVIYEVFKARAEKKIGNNYPIKFFKKFMPVQTNQLKAICGQMEALGENPPYSSQELNWIRQTTELCLSAAKRNRQAFQKAARKALGSATKNDEENDEEESGEDVKLLTFEDILRASVPEKLQPFYRKYFNWANRTGFFTAKISYKAYSELSDAAERKYLYETLALENPLAPSTVSWESTPVLQTRLPDYVAAVLEKTHPVATLAQDLCVRANLSSMENSATLAIIGQLCSIGELPPHCNRSWYTHLKDIADKHFLIIPPAILDFMVTQGFTAKEKAKALRNAQSSVRKNYNIALGDAGVLLKPQAVSSRVKRSSILSLNLNAVTSPTSKIPGFLFRALMRGSKYSESSPEENMLLTAVCDLLLLPSYNSLDNLANLPDRDPGSLGFASNQLGIRGPWEIHIKVGDHYLLSWSEACVTLLHSSESLSRRVRSTLANHVVPLFLLKWFNGLKTHTPEIQFHPWLIVSILKKFTRLQTLAASNECLTFEDIFSTVDPAICYMNQRMLRSFSTKSPKNPANRHQETLDGLLDYMRKRREPEDTLLKRIKRKNLKDLNPIEGKESDLDTTYRLSPQSNVQSFLDKWDNAREQDENSPPMRLNEAVTEVLRRFVPADHAPEIVSDVLDIVRSFHINLNRISPNLWSHGNIIEGLLGLQAPLPILQMALTLRAGKAITLARPQSNSFAVSGTAGDVRLLSDCVALHARTGYLQQPLSAETRLTELDISSNQLRSLDSVMQLLGSLSSLTTLNIGNNPLHNPRPLHVLTQLQSLDVSNTFCHAHPRLSPVPGLLTDFLNNQSRGQGWPDIRLLISPNFLHSLRGKITSGEVPNPQLLIDSYANLVPLPNLAQFVNTPDGPCIQREDELLGEGDVLIRRLGERVQQTHCDLDLLISLLHRLGENHWNKTLSLRNEGHVSLSDKVFAMIQSPYAPRAIAFKVLFALKFGFPEGTVPYTLAFHNVTNLAPSLKRLEITNFCPPPEFLSRLGQFVNLGDLTLDNNKRPQILADLPRLPRLTHLAITGNKLDSLSGLFTSDQNLKFTDLECLNLANNALTNQSNLQLLLNCLRLSRLDLSGNLLTQLPALGNLRHLTKQDYRWNNIPSNLLKSYKNTDNVFFTPQKEK
ncbi:MAG: leucine-rich repeat domain-containing protein [Alphaproteobacteria bacterium]|nr:leucine-rich repeat domain-containing protein [Alphaproteobacteria bacterium]